MSKQKQNIDDTDFFKEIEKYNRKRDKLISEIEDSLKKQGLI